MSLHQVEGMHDGKHTSPTAVRQLRQRCWMRVAGQCRRSLKQSHRRNGHSKSTHTRFHARALIIRLRLSRTNSPICAWCRLQHCARLIGRRVQVAGVIVAGRRIHTASGRLMTFASLCDATATIELTLFEAVAARYAMTSLKVV